MSRQTIRQRRKLARKIARAEERREALEQKAKRTKSWVDLARLKDQVTHCLGLEKAT